MNKKKITALLLSSVMALTPAMPAMAEQSTIVNYVDGTTDSTVETPDVTPTPLPEKKEGWETVDGVKYYYVNGEKITNKVEKIGKYTYCFDKTGKTLLYQDRKGFEDEWRKHHTSSITRDVWMYDTQSKKHTNLTRHAGEDRNPVLSPDNQTVYFLSERDGGSFNVYSFPLNAPQSVNPVTSFKTHPDRKSVV